MAYEDLKKRALRQMNEDRSKATNILQEACAALENGGEPRDINPVVIKMVEALQRTTAQLVSLLALEQKIEKNSAETEKLNAAEYDELFELIGKQKSGT